MINFMIIGSMKSGTTTISRILRDHPLVGFYDSKESDYFSLSKDWKAGLQEYHGRFPQDNPEMILAEASTSYTAYPHYNLNIPGDLHAYNPDLKLIYLMRDPVERSVSHYKHFYERGYLDSSVNDAIVNFPQIIDRSRYYMQIKPYLEIFGPEQVKILSFEHYLRNKQEIIADLCDFLGIDHNRIGEVESVHSNSSDKMVRRSHKIDFLYQFIYRNSLGKTFRNLIPKPIRETGSRLLTKSFARKVPKDFAVSQEYLEVIARKVESDVYDIEKLMGRKLTEWKTFYDTINAKQ